MGIPLDADMDVDAFDEEAGEKGVHSWSYSQYLDALDREDVLNDADEATFSCATNSKSESESSERLT